MSEEILDLGQAEVEKHRFEYASNGTRFGNYIIDYIICLILQFGAGFLLVMLKGEYWVIENELLVNYGVAIVIIWLYYTISETLGKGKTVGKLITGTRAVKEDDTVLDFGSAAVRSLCRFIPFEQFSFLGTVGKGWHDSISKTKVIKDGEWSEEAVQNTLIERF